MIGKVAYRLDLPVVFHVSLLQEWHAAGNLQPPPPRFVLSGEQVYTVDRILDHRLGHHGRRKHLNEFLIRWEGYGPEHDSWEPEANLLDPNLVRNYWDYVALREQHKQHSKSKSSTAL